MNVRARFAVTFAFGAFAVLQHYEGVGLGLWYAVGMTAAAFVTVSIIDAVIWIWRHRGEWADSLTDAEESYPDPHDTPQRPL